MKGITQGFLAQRCAHVSIIIDPSSFLACSLEIPQTQADVSDEKEINYVHVVLILIIYPHVQVGREFVILWQSVTVSQNPPCKVLLRVLGSRRADQHPLQVRNSL